MNTAFQLALIIGMFTVSVFLMMLTVYLLVDVLVQIRAKLL